MVWTLLWMCSGAVWAGDGSRFKAEYERSLRDPGHAQQVLPAEWRGHVLEPYLHYARLRGGLRHARSEDVEAFIAGHSERAFIRPLREAWLGELIRRGDDAGVVAHGTVAQIPATRCLVLAAAIRINADPEQVDAQIAQLYQIGASLPTVCDPVLAWWAQRGRPRADERLERAWLALQERQYGLARYLLRGLPEIAALDRARALREGAALPRGWLGGGVLETRALDLALREAARRDAVGALARWRVVSALPEANQDALAPAAAQIAMLLAASGDATALELYRLLPETALNADTRAWWVRAAIEHGDADAIGTALGALPDTEADSDSGRYQRAIAAERLGQDPSDHWQALRHVAGFAGFVAADRLGVAPTLCPKTEPTAAAVRARARERDFALVGALEDAGLKSFARSERNTLLARLSAADRALLAAHEINQGRYEAAIRTLVNPADQQQYALRFPRPYAQQIEREAKLRKVEPALVYALTRAESAFNPVARSSANARGLMQLLPSTAAQRARVLRTPLAPSSNLYAPALNIRLGVAELAAMDGAFNGNRLYTLAAYNAGPAAARRWQQRYAGLPSHVVAELIPYGETRAYVQRVLAFALIYEWLIDGQTRGLLGLLEPDKRTAHSHAPVCPPNPTVATLRR